ncbi:hypothetical protein CR103_03460 [Massilia psychrophila]|uniref:Uncharacterized protein n=1 Tax=Massilia psychrophila TaxID=1603353 RepID=A0A2G8T669_9BURK|nr:hypothetical protein CR103_03460 [Massilia psychrophila]GGE67111.1 hypothetical protein GCM10008020_09360 [Massilia psychrophila]
MKDAGGIRMGGKTDHGGKGAKHEGRAYAYHDDVTECGALGRLAVGRRAAYVCGQKLRFYF